MTRGKLIKQLDKVFSEYIRLRKANKQGFVKCFTCGKVGYWRADGMQAGHFISRKHFSTRWDEDNVQVQCVKCNIFGQGEQYKFGLHLGDATANMLYKKSQQTVKLSTHELREKISFYKDFVKNKSYL